MKKKRFEPCGEVMCSRVICADCKYNYVDYMNNKIYCLRPTKHDGFEPIGGEE